MHFDLHTVRRRPVKYNIIVVLHTACACARATCGTYVRNIMVTSPLFAFNSLLQSVVHNFHFDQPIRIRFPIAEFSFITVQYKRRFNNSTFLTYTYSFVFLIILNYSR
uniref:Uncharacterized protein n=1 Tax=Sipha flava TaxID=143950 RepID=A0A2S2QBX9_9HEMI